jgi:hypothetical protein
MVLVAVVCWKEGNVAIAGWFNRHVPGMKPLVHLLRNSDTSGLEARWHSHRESTVWGLIAGIDGILIRNFLASYGRLKTMGVLSKSAFLEEQIKKWFGCHEEIFITSVLSYAAVIQSVTCPHWNGKKWYPVCKNRNRRTAFAVVSNVWRWLKINTLLRSGKHQYNTLLLPYKYRMPTFRFIITDRHLLCCSIEK